MLIEREGDVTLAICHAGGPRRLVCVERVLDWPRAIMSRPITIMVPIEQVAEQELLTLPVRSVVRIVEATVEDEATTQNRTVRGDTLHRSPTVKEVAREGLGASSSQSL